MSAPDRERAAVEPIARRVVEAAGDYLEEVLVRRAGRRLLVQVVVGSDTGLNLDDLAELSRSIDRELESAAALGEAAFTLEVTTRGLDRPLQLPWHFRANLGRLIKLKPVGASEYVDRLVSVDEVELQFESGRKQLLAEVEQAFVELEFNRKGEEPIAFDVEGEEK